MKIKTLGYGLMALAVLTIVAGCKTAEEHPTGDKEHPAAENDKPLDHPAH